MEPLVPHEVDCAWLQALDAQTKKIKQKKRAEMSGQNAKGNKLPHAKAVMRRGNVPALSPSDCDECEAGAVASAEAATVAKWRLSCDVWFISGISN